MTVPCQKSRMPDGSGMVEDISSVAVSHLRPAAVAAEGDAHPGALPSACAAMTVTSSIVFWALMPCSPSNRTSSHFSSHSWLALMNSAPAGIRTQGCQHGVYVPPGVSAWDASALPDVASWHV